MAGPILRWLVTHEPENVAAARWALQPKDWVRLRMTGEAATDPTDASGTLLFDLERDAWADDLIAALGLPRGKLPPLRGVARPSGALLPGPAAELGLPPGIPVAAGAADTAAALYAADLGPDEAMLTLGSGGQWAVPEAEFRPTAATNLYRAVGDGYYRLAPAQNVGVTLNWVRTLLNVSWADLYDAAARPARPDAPVFVPYLTPERWDPAATSAWTALTLAHRREDLLRSALDGVAALLRQRLDDLRAAGHDPRSVVLGGGGAAHPAWRDLLADALGLPLRPAPAAWLTAVGAARLAAAVSRQSALLLVREQVAQVLTGVVEEVAPGVNDLQVGPPRLADAPVAELEHPRAGDGGDDGGVGGHDHLGLLGREVVQQRDQAEAGDERQRRVRLVHQVEAALVGPGPQDLEEPLAVAELVQPLGPAAAGMLFQERVERVHGVGPQEVRPRRPPASPRSTNSRIPASGSLALTLGGRDEARSDPPCGLSPYASASNSTTVDFPDPFSPTRIVIPGGSSSPSRSSCAAAGTVAGHARGSTAPPADGRNARTSRVSNVQSLASPTS